MKNLLFKLAITAAAFAVGASTVHAEDAKKTPPADKAAEKPGDKVVEAPKTPELEPGSNIVCEVDVFFTWRPAPPKADAKEAPVAAPEAVKDFFITAGEEGIVQEEITNQLLAKIPQFSQQALELCNNLHQDQTLCVTSKLNGAADHYGRLDFTARRALVEAINADCAEQSGECIGSEVSDVQCRINRSPDMQPAPSPTPEAAAGAKGAKDAKKK